MKRFQFLYLMCLFIVFSCKKEKVHNAIHQLQYQQYITVLGVAQDAGLPQLNCEKKCCKPAHSGLENKVLVSCLGLVDLNSKKKWLFDATPDITEQIQVLKNEHLDNDNSIDGIFLTHAHIGHYTGLMYLGKEALGAYKVPVYSMPKMKQFIENNGPWSQLVSLNNIEMKALHHDSIVLLNPELKVTPFIVPHRDEFSETVGFKIEGKNKSALFIPDIDKWNRWDRDIIEEVKQVDYAFLDASFFQDGELDRDMSKIPHPFTTETTTLFEHESKLTKSKIYFIHFNHTNPTIREGHHLRDSIQNLGFNFAKVGDRFEM
ncbi:MBL fold metallo-hydrolase [Psychroserpens sp. MEBiC05023]